MQPVEASATARESASVLPSLIIQTNLLYAHHFIGIDGSISSALKQEAFLLDQLVSQTAIKRKE